jgi:hypothetical protein
MKHSVQLTKTVASIRRSLKRSPWRRDFFVIPFLLASPFALSPAARAACEEGCDTNFNTFLGVAALANNTTGISNTAIGYQAAF